MKKLYDAIGENAVNKATPKLLLKGGIGGSIATASLIGLVYVGSKGYKALKKRKEAKQAEPALQKELEKAIEDIKEEE